jgi:hypothetical protein
VSDHIQQTIAHYQAKLREQEKAVQKTKMFINELCVEGGLQPMYPEAELESSNGTNLSIQADQFYGVAQATALRQILEMRRALRQGPATVHDLYNALVQGGFAFETKNEENAKRGLRISLTKNSAIFHKLPNGKFGLLEWYPNAKNIKRKDDETESEAEPAAEAQAKEADETEGGDK